MEKKTIFITIITIFVVFSILQMKDSVKVYSANNSIEVLIDGIDDLPKAGRIGESIEFEEYIEMWHHSGGYWKYKDIRIDDSVLENDLFNENALANAIDSEITFEYKLDSELYNKLTKNENLKVVCSTKLKDPATGEYKTIDDIFYEKPSVEIKNNKIYFKGRPRFNFYNDNIVNFSYIIGDILNVQIPLVDPDYGMNLYAIWRKRNPVDWGGAWGYFDKDDIFATPDIPTIEDIKELVDIPNIDDYDDILDIPNIENILGRPIQELGAIAPSQIKNASGHLEDGFRLISGGQIRNSSESSVGSGTFIDGGAVGLIFYINILCCSR